MQFKIRKLIYGLIYHTDQYLRVKISSIQNMLIRRIVWYAIKTLDIFNQKVIFFMINKYGWPLIREYGEQANVTAYYVLMHSNKAELEKYFPALKEAAQIEKQNCKYACSAIDRIMMHKKRKQIFGTDARGLRSVNGEIQYYVYPIAKFHEINKRRSKVGLNTIEEHAKENEYILNYDDAIQSRLINYPN